MRVSFRNFKLRSSHRKLNSEINITPFIDVALVLLIIFMVTSPMIISGINVELPNIKAEKLEEDSKKDPIVLSINSKSEYFIENQQFSAAQIKEKLAMLLDKNPDLRVLVKGDKKVNYGSIIALFKVVQDVGVSHISLITIDQE